MPTRTAPSSKVKEESASAIAMKPGYHGKQYGKHDDMVAVSIQQNTEQRAKGQGTQRIHDKKYTAGKSQVDNFAVCTNETHDGSKAYCAQKTNEGNRQSRCFNKSAQAQRFDFHALAKTGHDSMNFSGKRYDNNCYGDYIAEIQRIDGIYFRQGDAEKRVR